MAITNKDRISRMLEALGTALENPVGARMAKAKGSMWVQEFIQNPREAAQAKKDPQILLKAIDVHWKGVFDQVLNRTHRSIAVELHELRNRWAHNAQFTYRDADRALDSAELLLQAFQCKKEADAIGDLLAEVRRTQFAEEARTKLRAKTPSFEGMPKAGLKPWREVVIPHKDVMSRGYAEAKFAADLAQVIDNEGEAEYRDPREFFARTYLTYGLSELLKGAILRLNGKGGPPWSSCRPISAAARPTPCWRCTT
jgi:hypothetical protein